MTDTAVSRCHFCTATRDDGRKLVHGPATVICDRCVADAVAAVVAGEPAQGLPDEMYARQSEFTHCLFCGKPALEVNRLIYRGSACICDECVQLCLDILGGDDPTHTKVLPF